jgi:hypothetical protein
MNREAFVYEWKNLTNGKSYIGYHKGNINDGYIASSHSEEFWNDFNNPEMKWDRKIIAEGTSNDCLVIEQKILREINIKDDKYYNNARGAEIIFTKSVLDKMSKSAKKRWENMTDDVKEQRSKKISESKKGIPRPKEVGENLSKLFKGKSFIERYGEDKAKLIGKKISESNKGQHYHSEEHKQSLSSKLIGNKYGKNQSEESRQLKREKWLINNPGKNPTYETRKKMSENRKGIPSLNKGVPRKKVICPYCDKEGGEGLMQRWHFDNCKNK